MAIGINKFGAKASITLASSFVVLSSAMATQRAAAQEADEQDAGAGLVEEEVVVQGTRQSLQNAQDIKRDASTFVDAISASDIGSLPDRSVLEAMQRLPGVSIERFAAKNDPDHFSAEGSGAVVRGMTATRTEFNGRDSFTANSGRGLSFQDVPQELMGSVQLYKNQSADMIEGGIGGTVSLHTRMPFDQDGQKISFSADSTYYDLREDWSPTISGLYSNRWDYDGGEFGLLVAFARSEVNSRSDGIQAEVFQKRDASLYDSNYAVGEATFLVPNGSNVSMKEDDRTRTGTNVALQWADDTDTLQATAVYFKSQSDLTWSENKISYQGDDFNSDPVDDTSGIPNRTNLPMTGTSFEFDNNGVFSRGYLAHGGDGWRASADDQDRIPQGYSSDSACWSDPAQCTDTNRSRTFGSRFQTTARFKDQQTNVEDFSVNLKITPSDMWEISIDYQHVDATTTDDDMEIFLGALAVSQFDITGSVPTMALVNPWDGVPQATKDNLQGDPEAEHYIDPNDPAYFANESSYWWKAAMDHYERSKGEMDASRIDATRFFDDGFITSVKAGVRYARREQNVAYSRYNWGALAEIFTPDHDDDGFNAAWLDLPVSDSLSGYVEEVDWSSFNRGGDFTVPGTNNRVLHPSRELARAYRDWGTILEPVISTGADNPWEPANMRDTNDDGVVDAIGYFLPSEISDVTEENNAAYIRLDFASDLFGMRFSGNVGARYFKVKVKSGGFVTFPDLQPDPNNPNDSNNYWDPNDGFDQLGFGNNYTEFSIAENEYDDVLPSLNLKLEILPDLIGRFAVSKAVAMPDIGQLRNYLTIDANNTTTTYGEGDQNDQLGGLPVLNKTMEGYKASAGNPYLAPMESIQYDLSTEWYFADVGSLTGTLFYKDLSNFFVDGAFPRQVTNSSTGVTQTVNVDGPINSENGTMSGFELAYQQFYDFLPSPWDGLGSQINYTYIDAKSVPNPGLAGDPSTVPSDQEREDRIADEVAYNGDLAGASLPLESQSRHTANIVGMFEKGDWNFRIAYNWRSRYLVTSRDVISPNRPIWAADSGYLDSSLFYKITDQIEIGIQGTNLTNTVTKTEMQIDADGNTQGRSWFTNDRRYALIVRGNF
ncbi:TonB-dependent receptor [Alteromonadaceae bacterium 2753L.S.0a.02]|nr:TonB-dependent receptor [Alteromonadaceae bacterium 2753L.S.0a.02]